MTAEIPADLPRRDIDNEAEEQSHTPEIATVYQWNGKDLFPFSSGRHCALQRLHVTASPIEGAAACIRLCQLTPAEVTRIRGANVEKFLMELADWMEKENIGLGDKNGRGARTDEAIRIYNAMFDDLYDANSIEPEGGGGAGNA